jgi:hypothetical protein
MAQTQSIASSIKAVSESMASAFALTELTAYTTAVQQQLLDAFKPALDMRSRYSDMFKPVFADMAGLQQALTVALRPVAAVAVADWAKHFSSWSEDERKLEEALRAYGWWVPLSWTPDQARQAIQIGKQEGKRALDQAFCDHFRQQRHRELRKVVAGWGDEPEFKLRRPIIMDALTDHAFGRYRVSIPTLLPVIEGVVAAVFQPTKADALNPGRAMKNATQDERVAFHGVLVDAMVHTLTSMWANTNFLTANPRAQTLNRHLILHGRSVGYGREVNSLKVFLALDQVASQVRTKRERDKKAA